MFHQFGDINPFCGVSFKIIISWSGTLSGLKGAEAQRTGKGIRNMVFSLNFNKESFCLEIA